MKKQKDTRGPLERLTVRGIKDHCENCGAGRTNTKRGEAQLEAAFDSVGEPKTLCWQCRMGAAELYHSRTGITLSDRELDTVLAALRNWQDENTESLPVVLIENASEHGEPLTNDEIDELCERINCGDNKPTHAIFVEVQGGVVSHVDGHPDNLVCVVDWDNLKTDAEEAWHDLSAEGKEYIKTRYPDEYKAIHERIAHVILSPGHLRKKTQQ
jgi:hypothetical protein